MSNVQLATDSVLNIDTLGRQGGKSDSDGNKLITKQTGDSVDEAKCPDRRTSPFLVVIAPIVMAASVWLSTWVVRQITVLLEEPGTMERQYDSSGIVSPCELLTR